jgi:hypothetical protein
MLRFAAASSSDDLDDEIPQSAAKFFNCETVGKATQELISQLEALKCRRVAVATGTIQSLKEGDFLWKNDITPSNLSVFMFSKSSANAASVGSRALILHYQESLGKELSENEIKKALKQAIIVPTDFYGMVEQMERFLGALRVFQGKKGYLPSKYSELVEEVKELQDWFEAGQEINQEFIAGFMYLTDVCVHKFLKSCNKAHHRDDVRNSLLQWQPLLDRIKMQDFSPRLPNSFTFLSDNNSNPTPPLGDEAQGRGRRRKGHWLRSKEEEDWQGQAYLRRIQAASDRRLELVHQ